MKNDAEHGMTYDDVWICVESALRGSFSLFHLALINASFN